LIEKKETVGRLDGFARSTNSQSVSRFDFFLGQIKALTACVHGPILDGHLIVALTINARAAELALLEAVLGYLMLTPSYPDPGNESSGL